MARTVRGLDKKDSSLMFREITPPHGWKQNSDFHYLRLTLPGFEAKDITIHMDKYGHLVVRGNKQMTEHKYICFEETFDVPNDADLEQADGQFEDNQIYCITIPKKNQGQRIGHVQAIPMPQEQEKDKKVVQAIPMPQEQEKDKKVGSIHKYDRKEKPEGSSNPQGIPNNPLQVISRDKSKKRTVFFVAILIALLAVAVVLIVKFRHR